MNIFMESQLNLFEYYCTYFRHEEFRKLNEEPPVLSIILISKYERERSEVIKSGLVTFNVQVIDPKSYTFEENFQDYIKSLNLYAVFDDGVLFDHKATKRIVKHSIKYYREIIKALNPNLPDFPYNVYEPSHNLNPPMLRPDMSTHLLSDLRSFLMMSRAYGARLNSTIQIKCTETGGLTIR